MLKLLKKIYKPEIVKEPVVTINGDEVKTYFTVAEAIADLENSPNIPKEKLDKLKITLSKLKLTGKIKIKNGEIFSEEAK